MLFYFEPNFIMLLIHNLELFIEEKLRHYTTDRAGF